MSPPPPEPFADLVILCLLIAVGWGMVRGTGFATRARWLDLRPALRLALRAGPALAYAGWAGKLLFDLARDPTSHNLWPFEMVFVLLIWGAAAVGLAVLLALLGRVVDRGR